VGVRRGGPLLAATREAGKRARVLVDPDRLLPPRQADRRSGDRPESRLRNGMGIDPARFSLARRYAKDRRVENLRGDLAAHGVRHVQLDELMALPLPLLER